MRRYTSGNDNSFRLFPVSQARLDILGLRSSSLWMTSSLLHLGSSFDQEIDTCTQRHLELGNLVIGFVPGFRDFDSLGLGSHKIEAESEK